MDLNNLKGLHEDLRKIIIDKWVKKNNLSLGNILIDHEKTEMIFYSKDNKGNYLGKNKIEFSNNSWIIKEE